MTIEITLIVLPFAAAAAYVVAAWLKSKIDLNTFRNCRGIEQYCQDQDAQRAINVTAELAKFARPPREPWEGSGDPYEEGSS